MKEECFFSTWTMKYTIDRPNWLWYSVDVPLNKQTNYQKVKLVGVDPTVRTPMQIIIKD